MNISYFLGFHETDDVVPHPPHAVGLHALHVRRDHDLLAVDALGKQLNF